MSLPEEVRSISTRMGEVGRERDNFRKDGRTWEGGGVETDGPAGSGTGTSPASVPAYPTGLPAPGWLLHCKHLREAKEVKLNLFISCYSNKENIAEALKMPVGSPLLELQLLVPFPCVTRARGHICTC